MSKQRYQVLLTDADRFPISEADQTTLEALGAEILEVPYGIEEDELINACRDVDAVIVYSPKMTERVIHSMKRCQIMARCGIGIDNIDISAAIKKGIVVTYVPDYCIEEVSDHTIALMFDCWRRISLSNERVRRGHWDSYRELGQMRRIAGQTIGYVGFGRIAQAVARKLQTFNVHMKAYDPNLSTEFISSYGVQPVSFNELVESCDLISLHVPLLKDTWHMINQPVLAQMKRGVILINTSRGKLIDEAALCASITSGHVAAAGFDVLEAEPPPSKPWFAEMPQVVVTPHSAAFSEEALSDVTQRAVEEIVRRFTGKEQLSAVPMS
ncbi:D-3-phosphoglycerate dehydrogenase [Paenibacillus sp. 1_12]|uniref:C-terminal binding protein n=1 Tax=Paenibacillus sp. 1_12 TaxID=1566278 RepID=UPI0008F18E1B|nr:C-terminal binding protein [Paenibacillus sp. 1_12]SFL58022.1 D-3-phosphoglycerate dehydrogenase [Paenibacillus sp. 1_12]